MKFLATFASTPDTRAFRVDELVAVAHMFAIPLRILDLLPPWESVSAKEPLSIPIPFPEDGDLSTPAVAADAPPTVISLAQASSAPQGSGPFAYFDVPTVADAKKIAARCVLLQSITIVFCEGKSVDECTARIAAGELENAAELAALLGPETSFKYSVDSSERKYSQAEKVAMIKRFEIVGHRGAVKLSDPDVEFKLILQHDHATRAVARVYFGREVAVTNRSEWLDVYGLKRRPYIGTTSMPPELTFLMANLANVRPHDFVYDPFCGTGSSLVTAAALGAHCMGSDMDGRAMRAGTVKSQGSVLLRQQQDIAMKHYDVPTLAARPSEFASSGFADDVPTPGQIAMATPISMLTNFHAYGLWSWPERVRMNFSLSSNMWRPRSGWLDAIISDPPYGIREQKRKVVASSASAEEQVARVEDVSATCIAGAPDAEDYDTLEMVLDLVFFAAQALVVGGRLVYWHPTTHHFTIHEIARHPSFRLRSCVAQQVNLKLTRVLITLEKVAEPPEGLAKAACRPLRHPDNVRELMDAKEVPQHPSYAHYKEKKERKWERNAAYFEEQRGGDLGSAQPIEATDEAKSKRQVKRETAVRMAGQRQNNIERAARKHRMSHLEQKELCGASGLSDAEAAELAALKAEFADDK